MNRLRWLAVWFAVVALIGLQVAERSDAQTLGVPTITSISPSVNQLTINWNAPSDVGGVTITSYDLRYIRSDASDLSAPRWTVIDSIWTSGTLSYVLTGLPRDVEYFLQVRADNGAAGLWSEIESESTTDHGRFIGGATSLPLGSSADGRIDPADPVGDRDLFKLDLTSLTSSTELWVYTTRPTGSTSGLDAVGRIYDIDSFLYAENALSFYPEDPLGFSIRVTLPPAVYFIWVESFRASSSGSYVLHAQSVTDPGYTAATATTVELGSLTAGRITPAGGVNGDKDYFKLVLSESKDIWVTAIGAVDTVGALLNSSQGNLVTNDNGGYADNEDGFMLRRNLNLGIYYIRVRGKDTFDAGPYTLFVSEADNPPSSATGAIPIELQIPRTGHLDSTSDVDYFELTLIADTYVHIYMLSFNNNPFALEATLLDGTDEVSMYNIAHEAWDEHNFAEVSGTAWGKLEAGTYHIKVSVPSGASGSNRRYLIHSLPVTQYANMINVCTVLTKAQSDALSDPLSGCQWYLSNSGQIPIAGGAGHDINVVDVWDDTDPKTMGAGVNVAVVDDGLHYEHEDLTDNVEESRNHDYYNNYGNNDIFDPLRYHGTSVAGVIAARDNAIGMRGVAPRATIYGFNLLGDHNKPTADDIGDAMFPSAETDDANSVRTSVSNNSWGVLDKDGAPKSVSAIWESAVVRGINKGLDGKGIVYVWAAGNGHLKDDYANLGGYESHYAVIAVCAVNFADRRSSYSEMGPNLWVCAPSSDKATNFPAMATTRNGSRYRVSFGGTSAAAPIVSGVVALVRAANNELTWRDVKLILAASARELDPSNSGWLSGATKYGASGSYQFNHEYGFGTVDAEAAVNLAKNWSPVPDWREVEGRAEDLELTIPDAPSPTQSGTTVESSITIDSNVDFIEFVEINALFDHASFRDLDVELISPAGRKSILSPAEHGFPPEATAVFSHLADNYAPYPLSESYRFGTARHLGENSAGQWTLRITDRYNRYAGKLKSWELTIYGHGTAPTAADVDDITTGVDFLTVTFKAPDDTGNTDINGYDLRFIRSGATDRTDTDWSYRNNIATTDEDDYVLTGLAAGVEYDVQVRAKNNSGDGPWSDSLMQHTTPVAPTAPSIDQIIVRSKELVVAWDPPDAGTYGIHRYEIRDIPTVDDETDDSNWTKNAILWSPGSQLRYVVTRLSNGTQYDVQVRAINRAVTDITVGPWSSTKTRTPNITNREPSFPWRFLIGRSFDEHTPAGQSIGEPVQATPDADGDPLTYSISGSFSDLFDVDENTGQLLTKTVFDYEVDRRSHTIFVEVSDHKDHNRDDDLRIDQTQPVKITLENVNEAPIVSGTRTFDFREDRGSWDVGSYSASDPDSDMITWSLSGPDLGDLLIDQSGNLSFSEPPDADRPADEDEDSKYEVNVVASDGRLQGELDVTVNINDVPEKPVITGPDNIDYPENSTRDVGAYSASDPEGGTVIWTLTGPNRNDFTLTGSSSRRTLRFMSPPSFESQATYNITIQASDGALSSEHLVTISIENLNESGSLTFSSDQPVANAAFRAIHTDLDGLVSQSWSWRRSKTKSAWESVSGSSDSYTPTNTDVSYFLRATVDYEDGHGSGKQRQLVTQFAVQAEPTDNLPPEFPSEETGQRSVPENSLHRTIIVKPVSATDPNMDRLTYGIDTTHNNKFEIDRDSGQLRVGSAANLDHETKDSYNLTVTATDPSTASASQIVTITIEDVNEPPVANEDSTTIREDSPTSITVLANDMDPEKADLMVTAPDRTSHATLIVQSDGTILYTPNLNFDKQDKFSYQVSDGTHRASAEVNVIMTPVNDPPEFPAAPVERDVAKDAKEGDRVGKPVTAMDVDGDQLMYSIDGGFPFDIDELTGQILVAPNATFDPPAPDPYSVDVDVQDPDMEGDSITVKINVVERLTPPPTVGGGGGGGGPPPIPVPSDVEFEWNVTRDIEELHRDNDLPTDIWSNGVVLWVVENSPTGADRLFAYDLNTGERLEPHEFELDQRNRFSHGIWSDGEIVWIADSGQDQLFAYNLSTGDRVEDRDLMLDERNRDPRGIWSNGTTVWVLDSVKDALFGYDFNSGRLLTEFPLDKLNRSPRGLWSDGFTFWVSDDGAKRLLAYRVDGESLSRVEDVEFTFRSLLKAGNGDARGIWSDGDVIFVADEQDDHVYTYNMPNVINARLASLTLSGIEIGLFSPVQTQYFAIVASEVTRTSVEAEPAHSKAVVEIQPDDIDVDPQNGHQAAVLDGLDIVISVTSEDGSRTREYRVEIRRCLSGLSEDRLSTAQFAGGSVSELIACASSLDVNALYHFRDGVWVAYFLDGPDFLNQPFRNRFADGVPGAALLFAKLEPMSVIDAAKSAGN